MHLHLGGPGSNTIVYLCQYLDKVEIIEIGTHAKLDVEKQFIVKKHNLEKFPEGPEVEYKKLGPRKPKDWSKFE